MLYRTQRHNHFSLHIQSFSPFSFSPLSLQEMGPDYGSGFDPEAAEKTTAAVGDIAGVIGPVDDLFVDGLLDFSNEFSETEEQPPESEPEDKENAPSSHEKQETPTPENRSFVNGDDFGSFPESELSVQGESLESLEWLSNIVEDSFPDYSVAGKFPSPPTANQPEAPVPPAEFFSTSIQTKARTKRARTGMHVRPVLSPSFAESATSSSSASSTTSFSQPSNKRKKPAEGGGDSAAQRRCTHCGVTKTPQWRAGPCGPKTLCNACGVRYKSGRLLPEYRPACSPTFSSELHSNNHRKVLEMRRKKEGDSQPPPVHSF